MPERLILGRIIHEAPRRLIAGADCWLSDDESWILAARLLDPLLRWRSEEETATPSYPLTTIRKGVHS